MTGRRLNEERGARRAAELRARFSEISNRAFRRRRLRVPGYGSKRRTNLTSSGRALVVWLAISIAGFAVAFVTGMFIF